MCFVECEYAEHFVNYLITFRHCLQFKWNSLERTSNNIKGKYIYTYSSSHWIWSEFKLVKPHIILIQSENPFLSREYSRNEYTFIRKPGGKPVFVVTKHQLDNISFLCACCRTYMHTFCIWYLYFLVEILLSFILMWFLCWYM